MNGIVIRINLKEKKSIKRSQSMKIHNIKRKGKFYQKRVQKLFKLLEVTTPGN